MAWRLMWHPLPSQRDPLASGPVSLLSDEVETEDEARVLVQKLRDEGFKGISVTAAGVVKIMTGSELQRWLDRAQAGSAQ